LEPARTPFTAPLTDSAPIPRLGLLLGALLILLAWLGWHAPNTGEIALPWPLAAALAGAFVLGAAAGLLPGRRRQRAIAQEQLALASAGQDLLARIGTDRIAAPADPALRPLADLLNTFADHRQAELSRVSDRDNQLALTRRLTGWMYWEQDTEGRYTRLETETEEQSLLARSLLGRTRWECGGIQLGRSIAGAAANPAPDSQWLAHREQIARGKTFSEMVWSVPIDANRRVFIVESGRPRVDQDGRIVGYSGLIRDVGGALAAERATQNLMTALRVAPEPTLLIEATPGLPGWRVRWANAAACAMLGRTDSEILTASPDTLFGGDNRACIEAIGGALASGRGVRLESELADRYGQTRTASMRIDPVLPLEGLQPQAALSIDYFHAETERLREQAGSAHRLLSEQSARLSELEQASRELESFSYTVSHDLRAPLRVVDGFARILKDDFSASLDPTGHDHLNRILTAASRMNQMIDSLLSLARVSSQPIVPGPVDLSLLAQQIVDELRSQEPQRRVEVSIARSIVASGDRTLLRIVLENLLSNAWKYTGRTDPATIEFDCVRDGASTVYRVSDNGAGFDMRFADRLFGTFQRLHSANEFPGTGVGLATAARIVQRHRGRIWAESAPGEGARFHFTLNEQPASPPAH
jgi:signal transduction histidine kinase